MIQITNKVYCDKNLLNLDIPTKRLTNPYYDYPYMIIEDFFSKNQCTHIQNYMKESDNFNSAKIRSKDNLEIKELTQKDIRATNIYETETFIEKDFENAFLSHQSEIEKYFNISLLNSTKLQLLEYNKDQFYKAHSDDSNLVLKDGKLIGFKPVAPQRKLTTVVFINECDLDFQGGELVFNYLFDENKNQIKVKPKTGDMLVFLSNPIFTHEVLKVVDGTRISLVQWHNAIE